MWEMGTLGVVGGGYVSSVVGGGYVGDEGPRMADIVSWRLSRGQIILVWRMFWLLGSVGRVGKKRNFSSFSSRG